MTSAVDLCLAGVCRLGVGFGGRFSFGVDIWCRFNLWLSLVSSRWVVPVGVCCMGLLVVVVGFGLLLPGLLCCSVVFVCCI